jgi:purine-nucleoside phosphorylase
MEASALFTVSRYRETKLAACFTISDSLAEPEWKPEFLSQETGAGLETLYHSALSALLGD